MVVELLSDLRGESPPVHGEHPAAPTSTSVTVIVTIGTAIVAMDAGDTGQSNRQVVVQGLVFPIDPDQRRLVHEAVQKRRNAFLVLRHHQRYVRVVCHGSATTIAAVVIVVQVHCDFQKRRPGTEFDLEHFVVAVLLVDVVVRISAAWVRARDVCRVRYHPHRAKVKVVAVDFFFAIVVGVVAVVNSSKTVQKHSGSNRGKYCGDFLC